MLGVFFLQTNFNFELEILTEFVFQQSKGCIEHKIQKIFHLWSFLEKLWGFKDRQFANLRQLTRDRFRANKE